MSGGGGVATISCRVLCERTRAAASRKGAASERANDRTVLVVCERASAVVLAEQNWHTLLSERAVFLCAAQALAIVAELTSLVVELAELSLELGGVSSTKMHRAGSKFAYQTHTTLQQQPTGCRSLATSAA